MSIPKEPRQLMINLMYLVLTAMLALNVSAEIINAFYALNKGMNSSNEIVDKSNTMIKNAIETQVKAYNNAANQGYQSQALKAMEISKEFAAYIKSMTTELTTRAGGVDPHHTDGRPVRYKDKDVPTNFFITEKKGEELEKKIAETRQKFLALVTDPVKKKEFEAQIALQVDAIPTDSKAKNWTDLKFKQMPVAAVMPTLTKFVADAKTSETALLNYFFGLVGGKEIKFDQFKVAIAPKKAYLIRGDKFEADVYLAAYSSNPGTDVSISVNGSGLSMRDGVAKYETTPSGLGKQTVKASASIKNPLTGATTNAVGEFEYEVGEKSATVSAEKMNVFYVGVDNPIAVSAAGVSSNELKVSCSGCESLSKQNDNNYMVRVNRPGQEATITLSAGSMNVNKKFRIKAIPNPVAKIAIQGPFQKGGQIPAASMGANPGLIADLENFDFDARCSIQSYVLVRVPRREDPLQANVSGPSNGEAERLLRMVKPGDLIQYLAIKARCPGDQVARDIGSMSFFVK
jgi:gliding motility-associated protein GldM